MRLFPITTHGKESAERAHLTFWTLGATGDAPSRNGSRVDGLAPAPVPLQTRLRRLPEAMLLTAGYYAGKAPVLGELLRRPY